MYVSTQQRQSLRRVFSLLAEDMNERDLREQVGRTLLDLMRADHFSSFVWNSEEKRFDTGIWINMDSANVALYEAWFQYRDPITLRLQRRRHATVVAEVMPYRTLRGTEFFNDFLARDGLYWGINMHAFDNGRALGDLRIWRGRHRNDFERYDKELLSLIEPAFIAALRRSQPKLRKTASEAAALSAREREVVNLICRGMTDKEIARDLGIGVATVRTYISRIFDKTGIERRAGLARLSES